MCRPIESRDSLGVIGPAALFAAYQPSGNTKNLPNVTSTAIANVLANIRGTMNTTMWAMDSPPLNMNTFGSMDMLPMTTQPPALPFVCFPKTTNELSAMPWNNVTTSQDSMNCSLNIEQALEEEEMKPVTLSSPFTVPRRMNDANEAFEAAELEELLDFSMPDDLTNLEKDKEDLIHLEDGFDGTEMSILYSFLVDAPEEKALNADTSTFNSDDGILNLNMLQRTPLESLMESFEGDFTDEELKMTPPPSMEESKHLHLPKGSVPEVKSRRLCRAEDCYKRSRSNGMCISHGGGRRCAVEGCDKSSQGGNLCIRHGGGKRCSFEDCDKAAQSNFLCKAHGGGPRCQIEGCERSSQGGGHCRSHGGGKRCMFDGCQKGTQRGDYCALHGGSRLCEIPGCMRNDRGGGLCATHGGGKRCSVENCIKPCRRKGFCSAHLRQSESTK